MSLVPFSGQRPSLSHPNAYRTAQSLGRIARQLWDYYQSSSFSSSSTIMPRGKVRSKSRSSRANGMSPTNSADLAIKPPSVFNVPKRVPRNISNMLAWDVVKIDSTITPSGGSGITETNFLFTLSQHPQASSWAALFDQFCIPQASVSFAAQQAPGDTNPSTTFYTALDFDNITALGSVSLLEDYSTCAVQVMHPGAMVLRSVRPSPKTALLANGSLVSAGVEGPVWVDSIFPLTAHLGIRSISSGSAATVTEVIKVT
jgi:hypothetical protein